jgi:putative tryptophan/tyrosine transport system substrate-binding protein
MRRRAFIKLLAGAAVAGPQAAIAETSSKVYHLGNLNPALPMVEASPFGKILIGALAQRGYTLGQNLTYDPRGFQLAAISD